jgi:hypothetical protein
MSERELDTITAADIGQVDARLFIPSPSSAPAAAGEPILVQMRHIRQAGFCSSGMRAWFARHELDVLDFLRHGIPVERFEATGDHLALTVAAIARAERAAHG